MQMLFEKTCVVCHSEKLISRKKKTILGIITSPESFICENCGSIFLEDELRWKLVSTKYPLNPVWQQFHQKSFYVREWLSIGNAEKDETCLCQS
jgi:hypothetical protein